MRIGILGFVIGVSILAIFVSIEWDKNKNIKENLLLIIYENAIFFIIIFIALIYESYLYKEYDKKIKELSSYKYRILSDNGVTYTNRYKLEKNCIKTDNELICGSFRIIEQDK